MLKYLIVISILFFGFVWTDTSKNILSTTLVKSKPKSNNSIVEITNEGEINKMLIKSFRNKEDGGGTDSSEENDGRTEDDSTLTGLKSCVEGINGSLAVISVIKNLYYRNFSVPSPYYIMCYECTGQCMINIGALKTNFISIGCYTSPSCEAKLYLYTEQEKTSCSNMVNKVQNDVHEEKLEYNQIKDFDVKSPYLITCYECSNICVLLQGSLNSVRLQLACYSFKGCDSKIYSVSTKLKVVKTIKSVRTQKNNSMKQITNFILLISAITYLL